MQIYHFHQNIPQFSIHIHYFKYFQRQIAAILVSDNIFFSLETPFYRALNKERETFRLSSKPISLSFSTANALGWIYVWYIRRQNKMSCVSSPNHLTRWLRGGWFWLGGGWGWLGSPLALQYCVIPRKLPSPTPFIHLHQTKRRSSQVPLTRNKISHISIQIPAGLLGLFSKGASYKDFLQGRLSRWKKWYS